METATADTTHVTGLAPRLAERIAGRRGEPNGDGSAVAYPGRCDGEFDRLLEYVVTDDGMRHEEVVGEGGLTDDDIRNLTAILGHEVSANTRKNYRSQWRRFTGWAGDRGVSALPADPVQVAAYLAERMERHGHRPATLQTAAAAISFVHRTRGLADPRDTEEVRATLRSAARKAGAAQRQAEGITEQELQAIRATACRPRRWRRGRIESADTAERRGGLDIAMISVMRDALLRVSEAAALLWEDIEAEEDGTGRLLIRRSKTDAEGEGAVAFLSAPTMESLGFIRGEASDGDRVFGLRPNRIAGRIRQAALAAGLGEGYSGHSPRVGMARDLVRSGAELASLMTAGRWRSPRMPALYTRNERVTRGAVARYYGSRGKFSREEEEKPGMVGGADEQTAEGGSAVDDPSVGDSTGGADMLEPSPGVTAACGESPGARGVAKAIDGRGIMPFGFASADINGRMQERNVSRIKALIHALHFIAESIANSLLRPALLLNYPLCFIHSA